MHILLILCICILHSSAFVPLIPRYIHVSPTPDTTVKLLHERNRISLLQNLRISGKKPLLTSKIYNNIQNAEKDQSFEFKIWETIGLTSLVAIICYFIHEQTTTIDINGFFESSILKIQSMGTLGYLYFSAIYIVAEILAIPVFPLTASSGYIFGLLPGTLLVLVSGTAAACISFFVGRTILRSYVQKLASGNAKWRAIDKAIEKEGFKIVLLLRLSPLLPFGLSNYLYGITSVNFISFLFATFIGFAPGTLGIVYAGSAGKEIFSTNASHLPWYEYAGIGLLILLFGKLIADFASNMIKEIETIENESNIHL